MCEPESYAEAAKDANWRAAMEEEMHALAENETWDLVDAPKGVKPIGCRWVYKVKYNTDGMKWGGNERKKKRKPSNEMGRERE